jgi:hypothetical protein
MRLTAAERAQLRHEIDRLVRARTGRPPYRPVARPPADGTVATVRDLLRERGPARVNDLARASGVSRYEAESAIALLWMEGQLLEERTENGSRWELVPWA